MLSRTNSFGSGGGGDAPVVDYIVEQGTSGIWTYRKWNSGISECWGPKSCGNVAITAQWGTGLYEGSNIGDITYPSGLFIYLPHFWASVLKTDKYSVAGLEIDGGSITTTPKIYPLRGNSGTVQGLVISLYAKGFWK